MRPLRPLYPFVRVLPVLFVLLSIPILTTAQPVVSNSADLTPEARTSLTRAAGDADLAPWQREFMQGLARTGRVAAPAENVPAASAMASDGTWLQVSDPRPGIGMRSDFGLIYDSLRDRLVFFGGEGSSSYFNDVWVLSLSGEPVWERLLPEGTPPSERRSPTVIYDPVRDRLVLFGGEAGCSCWNDTWELSFSGTPAWHQLTPGATPPGGRTQGTSVYDSIRDRLVLFGGMTSDSIFNDVWALSLGDAPEWNRLEPTGALPSARYMQCGIYDPVGERMVVFGGFSGSSRLADLWTLSLGDAPAWSELTPTGTLPGARSHAGSVYDPNHDRMVVFGGYGSGGRLNDVWALSLVETPAWTELAPTGTPPSPRLANGAIYDPARDRMIAYGANQVERDLNELWALSLGEEPAWTELASGTLPGEGYGRAAIYDALRHRMVVFGGRYDYGYANYGDVWTLSLGEEPAWTRLNVAGTAPAARYFASAIYDAPRDRMVVFGGNSSSEYVDYYGTYLNDVWVLSLGESPEWTEWMPAGTPPGVRCAHSAIYDPSHDRMVVFGGRSGTSPTALYGDVWALSLGESPVWTELTPGASLPGARFGQSAIYDPLRGRMVVFGGKYGSSYLTDTWALSLGDTPVWSPVTPAGTPPGGRYGHSAVHDLLRDRMVVFGGRAASTIYSDVWALSLGDTSEWTTLAPVGEPDGQLGRLWHSAVYDPPRDRMVVFGGYEPYYQYMMRNDVWTLTWGGGNVPVQLALVSADAAPGRVTLVWYAAGGNSMTATVYRRTEGGAWAALGTIEADGTGLMTYEDRAVAAGTRYGYRLGVVENGTESYLGETWVDVPAAAELALAGVRPNPAAVLTVAFTLPDATPAQLEAFDVSGRRVAVEEVGALGAGSHVVTLGRSQALRCGVYLVRLTRASRVLTTRAVLVR